MYTLDVHIIDSRYLETSRRITVLKPRFRDGVERPRETPTLYLNDGQNLFEPSRAFAGQTWQVPETVNRLVREGVIPPVLVVGIDHGESRRAREYLAVEDQRNPDAREPIGQRYVDFVVREVVPFVERTYGAARRTSARLLGGSSYGAASALLTVLERPGVFGRLLLESPSLYVGDRHLIARAKRASRWPSRIYLGVGTAETSKEDIDRETVDNVRALAGVLRRAGLGARRLQVVVEEGATHSEAAWAARLPQALRFLLSRS